jgi:hypothetical protein
MTWEKASTAHSSTLSACSAVSTQIRRMRKHETLAREAVTPTLYMAHRSGLLLSELAIHERVGAHCVTVCMKPDVIMSAGVRERADQTTTLPVSVAHRHTATAAAAALALRRLRVAHAARDRCARTLEGVDSDHIHEHVRAEPPDDDQIGARERDAHAVVEQPFRRRRLGHAIRGGRLDDH